MTRARGSVSQPGRCWVALVLCVGIGAVAGPARAGTDADVTAGAVYASSGEWAEAQTALERALAEPVKLKAKNVPKAWFTLGRARAAQAAESVRAGDLDAADAFTVGAAEAFARAAQTDDGTWTAKLGEERGYLAYTLVNLSAKLGAQAGGQTGAEAAATWTRAEKAAALAVEAAPTFAVARQLRGQALQGLGRSAEAVAEFEAALDVFGANPSAEADPSMGYAAWQGASIASRELGDPQRGLVIVERGRALVAGEKARAKDDATREAAATVAADLDRLWLEILRGLPDRRAEAVAGLEAALAATPDDVTLLLALGQLEEGAAPARAVELYEKARAVEPARPEPPFMLGALYFNQGVDLRESAQKEKDPARAKALDAEHVAAMRKAREPMEAAYAANPTNLEAARALVTICVAVGDHTAAQQWLERVNGKGR